MTDRVGWSGQVVRGLKTLVRFVRTEALERFRGPLGVELSCRLIRFLKPGSKTELVSRDLTSVIPLDRPFPEREQLLERAAVLHRETGFWPISFSIPDSAILHNPRPKKKELAHIIPGDPYQFTSSDEYHREYQDSLFGLTHKKAGWDCFRHLEIISAGAFPLMPDAAWIPEGTMHFYPKAVISEATANYLGQGGRPDSEGIRALLKFARQNLTSETMVSYLLWACQAESAKRIVFVDESLSATPDYLSVFTLIGLQKKAGLEVITSHPVDYIYDDYRGDTGALYGRGFGYARQLQRPVSDTSIVFPHRDLQQLALGADLAVVGSLNRNLSLARQLVALLPPEKLVFLLGEDSGPTRREMNFVRKFRGNFFLREFRTGLRKRKRPQKAVGCPS